MGTPHRGADIASWTRILREVGNVITIGSVRSDLLESLEPKSKEFSEISKQFVSRTKDLHIVSVFEGRPTKGVRVCALWISCVKYFDPN